MCCFWISILLLTTWLKMSFLNICTVNLLFTTLAPIFFYLLFERNIFSKNIFKKVISLFLRHFLHTSSKTWSILKVSLTISILFTNFSMYYINFHSWWFIFTLKNNPRLLYSLYSPHCSRNAIANLYIWCSTFWYTPYFVALIYFDQWVLFATERYFRLNSYIPCSSMKVTTSQRATHFFK